MTTAAPTTKGIESKDSLIKDFTPGQKDYILAKVYPFIKKALVHFIAEAKLSNEIIERSETPTEESVDLLK
jgi:hypothetical protein